MEIYESTYQDYSDLAFEIETESALAAAKKAHISQKTDLAQIQQQMRTEKKQIAADLAVGRSKFVSESRQKLLIEATQQMLIVQNKGLEACVSKADSDKVGYGKLIQKLIQLGQEQIRGETVVQCRKQDQGLISGESKEGIENSDRGVIVQSTDGRITVDLTVKERVRQVCKYYAPQINSVILPEYELVE
ncbi:putative ATP synthase [Spironucleus salmonicida]|uniref:ATP synthase n=1 Tax=Spironucleus salmonicida TaxID=348837 RepID=V6LNJ4_9EUKA|nr:putative ATP synthase [Spironucleus salmonicida]|eukprot:EST46165.1 Putative ATP synthase [Spironucleus salmonicida]